MTENIKQKYPLIVIGLAVIIIVSVGFVVCNTMGEFYSDKFINSLMRQVPFTEGGVSHPWYIAPMEGYTVTLYNGSSYLVISDHWDSCEHNPNQGHLIGIGWTNKTLYEERRVLDQDVATRDYSIIFKTIIWVNATEVKQVVFQVW